MDAATGTKVLVVLLFEVGPTATLSSSKIRERSPRPAIANLVVLLGAFMMLNVLSIDITLPALLAVGAAYSARPDQIPLYLIGAVMGRTTASGESKIISRGIGFLDLTGLQSRIRDPLCRSSLDIATGFRCTLDRTKRLSAG